MLKAYLAAACLAVMPLAAAQAQSAASDLPPEIGFRSHPRPLQLPEGMNFGEVGGVDIAPDGHVFVFSRGGNAGGTVFTSSQAQLLEFDAAGRFVREIGKGLYGFAFAHAVRVDRQGNVWTTDKGADTVVKFGRDGHVRMVIGRRQETADETAPHPRGAPYKPAIDGQFRQPTNVAWDSQGNIYVADGYVNARIAKLDQDGNWLMSWGEHGSGPGQFDIAHDIVIDAADRIYVADRNNRRIQVFDTEGRFLRQITIDVPAPANAKPAIGLAAGPTAALVQPGAPWALCITPDQTLFVADAHPGRIYRMTTDGKVTGMLGSSGKSLGKFGWIHGLSCPSDKEVWVAEVLNWRVQKLELD